MAEAHTGKGLEGFLSKETSGLPNWAWVLVVGAGIVVAIVIPKLIKGKGSTNQPDATSTDSGTNAAGLGLAVDPTTGLPYAVEGLVPSGGLAGSQGPVDLQSQVNPPPPAPVDADAAEDAEIAADSDHDIDSKEKTTGGTSQPKTTSKPAPKPAAKKPAPKPAPKPAAKKPAPKPAPKPSQAPAKYYTVPNWPYASQIDSQALASRLHISDARFRQLNPKAGTAVKSGVKVRIA